MATGNGHGGSRKGAGRPKGSRNKATLARAAGLPDAVEAARAYAGQAFEVLAEVMGDSEAPASARVKAAGMLLDRAYGRPPALESRGRVETDAEAKARRDAAEAARIEGIAQALHGGGDALDLLGASARDMELARERFPDGVEVRRTPDGGTVTTVTHEWPGHCPACDGPCRKRD